MSQRGEKSEDSIIREFQEKLRAEVQIVSYLACVENIFTVEEEVGHEITQLYVLRFSDCMKKKNSL